jgi:hypothetical protein
MKMDKEQRERYEYAKNYFDKIAGEIDENMENAKMGEYERLMAESYGLLLSLPVAFDDVDLEDLG